MPKSAWCSHNKYKYQIIVNLFKGKGCKSKTQTSHLNSCLFTIEKRNFFKHKHAHKISGGKGKSNAIPRERNYNPPLSLHSSLVAWSVKVPDTDNRDRSVACYLQIFAMPEETGEAECALTIEKSILRVHCDHYGDVKGCECVGMAWSSQNSGLSVSNLCNMSLSPLSSSHLSPQSSANPAERAEGCLSGWPTLPMFPCQCRGKGNCKKKISTEKQDISFLNM